MQFDERMLRDIGLSRSDVIACLTAPDSGGMLEVRARRQAANIANASGDGLRRAA